MNNKPIKNQNHISNQKEVIAQYGKFSGPIPPPEILQGYNEISEDLTHRIFVMAELQQKEYFEFKKLSIESENKASIREHRTTRISLLIGMFSVFAIAGLCFYGFYLNHATQTASIAIGVMVALAAAFIIKNNTKKN